MLRHPSDLSSLRTSRRNALQVGGLAGLSACLPGLLGNSVRAASAEQDPVSGPMFGRAKQVIFLFLAGGPPQHETFDPKPQAPLEIRGPFKPISTNVPGIHFSELLPRTAQRAEQLAVIRSMFTNNNIHGGSGHWILTGRPMLTGDGENAQPTDWPNLASVVKKFRPSERVPALTSVSLPELFIGNGGNIEAGQFGGILGPQYSPELIECRPSESQSSLGGLYASRVPAEHMQKRVSLLDALGRTFDHTPRSATVQLHEGLRRQAFDLLTTGAARQAFHLEDEPDKIRERYGRNPFGQSVLLARRLVEAGVRFVTVNWPRVPGDRGVENPIWDTHARNFDRMEDCLAPQFDLGFTALLDDLRERGILDETLVIAVGEFGRTPRVNGNAGRDHWGSVFSCVLAGAGISGGQVYGSSDREGAYPASDPVNAGHLAATVFHLVGINSQGTFPDRLGRELSLTESEPLYKLLGEEPATTQRTESTGDLAFVPPYQPGLLACKDFETTTHLVPLDGPASPKGWRATVLSGNGAGFGVRLDEPSRTPRSALLGIWTASSQQDVAIPVKSSVVLAQQIRDPQSGYFTIKAKVSAGGTSAATLDSLFITNFRCRLVFFQYLHPSKTAVERMELASVEFHPIFLDAFDDQLCQTITLEKRMAPTPGINFSFGLGVGVAVMVENKQEGPVTIAKGSGDAYLRVHQIDISFDGWTFA
ncbi:DUF1501 domain-containing protein [Schlesneria sp. T3-172]|uniref:DUF1501 domain-containing protein n=1 Tax=Schlesneria sphaerica TaxID=3373610 RepID=UPI0037C88C13